MNEQFVVNKITNELNANANANHEVSIVSKLTFNT
jgi:hypothetical protein